MPIYHEHCGKPGPSSLSYVPPPEARLFKSRSAPGSPLLDGQPFSRSASFRQPRQTRASFLREAQLKKGDKSKSEKSSKIGRSKSFSSRFTSRLYSRAEQKNSLGKSWHPSCLKCEECGKVLNPGQHSEHRGTPYCNIPCYSLLFGPRGYGRGGVESHQKVGYQALTPDQESLRNELLPKLRQYNEHYESDNKRALQLASKEANGKLIIEGVLRVFWGLKKPVTLSPLYWRNDRVFKLFHIVPNGKKLSRSETMKQGRSNSHTTDEKLHVQKKDSGSRTITNSSLDGKLTRRHTLSHSDRKKRHTKSTLEPTRFIPPYGTSTTLRLSSKIPTPDVVKMILTKFQIADPCNKFTLFVKYENGEIKRLKDEETPLMVRLRLGPAEDLAKIYLMEDTEENTVRREVAQYIHFATPVLQAFIIKFNEEEEREIQKIKDRYFEYKRHLQNLIEGHSMQK